MFALPDDYQVGSKYVGVRSKLYLLPTQCIVCVLFRTQIISLYSTNCLVFISERECVYFAVRTGSLNVI
jgi:hypothetical protein